MDWASYVNALTSSFTDSFSHWPAFFGMALVDYASQMLENAAAQTGSYQINQILRSGVQGGSDLVKTSYAVKVLALKY
jgi:hypothetical protein